MVDFREVIEKEFKNEHRMNVDHSMKCLAKSGCNVALLYFKGWDVEYHAILPFDEDIILSGKSGYCSDIEDYIFGTKGEVLWAECYYNDTFDTEDIELTYGDEPMPNAILVTGFSNGNTFFQCIVTVVDPEYRKKKQLLKEAQEKEDTPYVCKDYDDILNHL